MGAGSETYASLMKSFIALLHCTFSSSSSLGAWDVKGMTSDKEVRGTKRARERRKMPVSHMSELRTGNHLRGRDVHHKFDGGKIVGERESILNQLQQ